MTTFIFIYFILPVLPPSLNNSVAIYTLAGTCLAGDFTLLQMLIKKIPYIVTTFKLRFTARVQLQLLVKNTKYSINNTNNIIWGDFNDIYKLFLPKENIKDRYDKCHKYLRNRKSCLLVGDAGAGKSLYLKEAFQHYSSKFWYLYNIISSTYVLYISAKEIINMEDFLGNITNAKYRKLMIFCDGLDELGENEQDMKNAIKYFNTLFQAQSNGKCRLFVSCRTSYAKRYMRIPSFERLFRDSFIVKPWNDNDIYDLMEQIKLLLLRNHASQFTVELLNLQFNSLSKIKEITQRNPLKCKMLCLSLISTDNVSAFTNNYFLYKNFFEIIIKEQLKRIKPFSDISNLSTSVLYDLSKIAFQEYKLIKDDKCFSYSSASVSDSEIISRILPIFYISDIHQFEHHTYKEFLTAYYYIETILSIDPNINNAISVLSCLYTNNYADFISLGLVLLTEAKRKKAIDYLIYIYYFTLFPLKSIKRKFKKLFQENYMKLYRSFIDNNQLIVTLNRDDLLYLKLEITFRIGRFCTKYPIEFIKFIYVNDCLDQYPNNEYSLFESSILKRQCAISASFLCNAEIEMDYVKKILNYRQEYTLEFDLVNRSHTLIYYGDILDVDILMYRDNGSDSWEKAKAKRLSRLKCEPISYTLLDRTACFRLFDLATLYSFLVSGINRTLTSDEIEIVRSAKVEGISAMPIAREQLMKEIKEKILLLT